MRWEKDVVTPAGKRARLAWGYDRPMHEYFAMLSLREEDHGPHGEENDLTIWWVGTAVTVVEHPTIRSRRPSRALSVRQMKKVLRPYGVELPDPESGYVTEGGEDYTEYKIMG